MFEKLEDLFRNAKKSITIISPYVKYKPALKLIDFVKDKDLDLMLITLPPGEEYITGATDVDAILFLQENGCKIQMMPNLHAKIYLIDQEILVLGSANFTNRGLGLIEDHNKEVLIEKKLTKMELHKIENEFLNNEELKSIDEYKDLKEKVMEIQAKFTQVLQVHMHNIKSEFLKVFPTISPHEELLKRLQETGRIENYKHIEKGYYRHAFFINDKFIVKVMRSKGGLTNQAKGFEVFGYQISKKTAELFINRKVHALILILEEPDVFVCLPTTFLINHILRKSYKGKNDDFQFKIKRNNDELLLSASISISKKTRQHPIEKYEGTMRFKIIK